ncbi:MFS transporter [Kitasatospora sp. NPDC058162]|uniref:MFS transporter n=1 Tax=Kitasatospora sp. NPDC058162 TaxID=3346362 RepID=UPI0036DE20C9
MRTWWPLAAVCLGTFLFLLDTTVLSVALPAIGAGLSVPLSALPWVVDVYTLVLAVLMLPVGALTDRLGARAVYAAGLAVFGLASLACGAAPTVGVLIAARGVQGVGGAAMAVTTFALIGSVYRGPDLGRAMGVFGAVTGLAAALGPVLGGVLTEYAGWRSVFLVNLPLTVFTLLLSLRVLPGGRRRGVGSGSASGEPAAARPGAGRIDLPGTLAFAVAAGALTWALSSAGVRAWIASAVAGIAVVAFVRIELRSSAPLLEPRLFARASFSAVLGCVLASTAAFAALVHTSVWLQSGLGLGPVRAALALTPLAAASGLTSLISGRRLHGRSPRAVLGTGLLLSALGCAAQAAADAGSSAGSLAFGLALTGVGVGLLGPAMGAAVFAALPPERAGTAAGAMATFRQLGQTLGVAGFGLLFLRGGAATAEGLDRVLLAAAVVAGLGAVLGFVFGPGAASGRTAEPAATPEPTSGRRKVR